MTNVTTQDICRSLNVSRAWLNTHLRPLGGAMPPAAQNRANARTIWYTTSDVIRWLNERARYSRQTVLLDLTQYGDEKEIRNALSALQDMPTNTLEQVEAKAAAHETYFEQLLPPEIFDRTQGVHPRNRGLLPWVTIQHHINDFDELRSMRQLMEQWQYRSQELCYRQIFMRAMIRVEIEGKVWYMDDPADPLDLAIPIRASEGK